MPPLSSIKQKDERGGIVMLKKRWLVFLLTMVMGLALPFWFWYLLHHSTVEYPILGMMCVIWPGYGLWVSRWAGRDIRQRWWMLPLFTVLLAATSWVWLDTIWPFGVLACVILLVIGVVVMEVTDYTMTKQ